MKKHIALGATLLLTLGTAVGGTLIYGQGQHEAVPDTYQSVSVGVSSEQVTPERIAFLKATATTADYITPKVPI